MSAPIEDGVLGGWASVVLADPVHDEARAIVVPERGGLVARFDVGGRAVLALDEGTLADPAKSVRGGIPVLFPSPGKLAADRWAQAGRSGSLPQHGFARTLPWEVIDRGVEGDSARVTMRLDRQASSDDDMWPWPTTFELTVSLRGGVLRLDQRVHNRGASPMPCGVGFHPYFAVAEHEKRAARLPTTATRAFDNVTKQPIALDGPIDLAVPELDLHLRDHDHSSAALVLPDRTIALTGAPAFSHWVLWTLAGRDFVCVEPWTARGDALNTGEGLLWVEPDAALTLWLEVSTRAA